MKKILIINTILDKGGAARVAYDLFKSVSSDMDIFYAYGRNFKRSSGKTFYFGNRIEVLIHLFLVRFLGLEGFGSYFATKKLIRFIRKEKFDLINLHNLHGYYVNFFKLLDFIKTSNIPIIYSLHDEWPITWMPAHSLGCNHCKTGLGVCTNTYSYPKNYFPIFQKYMLKQKRCTLSSVDNMTIVCPSLWLKESIEKSFLGKFKIETIHNGIDTNIFKPTDNKNRFRIKYNLPENKNLILFMASNLNDKSKGIHFILEAAKKMEDQDCLFMGLGNGHLNETSNVKSLGYIYNKRDLAEIYALSDLFCFASSAETFLLSAAESMSCGTPVVGFDIPVVRELVNNRVGILTKKTPESLCMGIKSLLENREIKEEMGTSGRLLIELQYSMNKFYSDYSSLYNKLS